MALKLTQALPVVSAGGGGHTPESQPGLGRVTGGFYRDQGRGPGRGARSGLPEPFLGQRVPVPLVTVEKGQEKLIWETRAWSPCECCVACRPAGPGSPQTEPDGCRLPAPA